MPRGPDTFLEIAEALALAGTAAAELRRHAAGGFVQRRTGLHQARGRLADLRASEQEPDMRRLHIGCDHPKLVIDRGVDTHPVAFQAIADATLHLGR